MRSYFLLPITILFVPFFVSAQEISEDIILEGQMATIVSDTNVHDAVISAKLKDRFVVDFTLQNGLDKPQGDVRYSVCIHEYISDDTSGRERDCVFSKESLTLAAGETIGRSVEYPYPSNLKGDFEVWATAMNSDGELGFAKAGQISLEGIEKGVSIDQESCFIRIDGVNKRFSPMQGVDFNAQEEEVSLTCYITNSGGAMHIVPRFTTTEQTQYGKTVETDESTYEFDLAQNETRAITFFIPLPTNKEPGAYDVNIDLYDDMDNKLDNTSVHYVLQGDSASIHDVHIDKDTYKKGDEMTISINWSGSADTFTYSRKEEMFIANNGDEDVIDLDIVSYKVSANVVDGKNKACAEKAMKNVDIDGVAQLTVDVLSNCKTPNVSVEILDEKNNVLAERTVVFDIDSGDVSGESKFKKKANIKTILMVAVGVLPIIVLIIFLLLRKRGSGVAMFVLMTTIGVIAAFDTVDARNLHIKAWQDIRNSCTQEELDTGLYCEYFAGGRCMVKFDSGNCSSRANEAKATVNLNSSTYNPGDNIVVTATDAAFKAKCTNPMGVNIYARIKNKSTGAWVGGWTTVMEYLGRATKKPEGYDWFSAMGGDARKTARLTAPTQCGPYEVWIKFQFTHGGHEFITRYTDFDFNVSCHTSTISAANPICAVSEEPGNLAIDPVDGRGSVDLTLSQVSLSGVRYAFKCGGGSGENWTNWKTNNTHTCQFDEPGTYAVRGRIGRVIGGVTRVLSYTSFQNVIIPECITDGSCTSATPTNGDGCVYVDNELTMLERCDSGDPINYQYDPNTGRWTWDCEGVGSTSADELGCCAQLNPGRCGDDTNVFCNGREYNYPSSTWNGDPYGAGCDFCDLGSPEPDSPTFPSQGSEQASVQWTCRTDGGTSEECSAVLNPPEVNCGPAATGGPVNDGPTSELCAGSTGVYKNEGVDIYRSGADAGKWWWTCVLDGFPSLTETCTRTSCISENPINYTSPVIISDDMTARLSVSCPNLCCTIRSTQQGSDPIATICEGGTDEVEVGLTEGGLNTFDATCWFDDGDGECNEDSEDCVDIEEFKIMTACIAKECNTQNSCQSTPVIAQSRNDSQCTSSCNSNADCSGGRLIETKP